jgi:hypothetical protein
LVPRFAIGQKFCKHAAFLDPHEGDIFGKVPCMREQVFHHLEQRRRCCRDLAIHGFRAAGADWGSGAWRFPGVLRVNCQGAACGERGCAADGRRTAGMAGSESVQMYILAGPAAHFKRLLSHFQARRGIFRPGPPCIVHHGSAEGMAESPGVGHSSPQLPGARASSRTRRRSKPSHWTV